MIQTHIDLPSLDSLRKSLDYLASSSDGIYLDTNALLPDFLYPNRNKIGSMSEVLWLLDDNMTFGSERKRILREVSEYFSKYCDMSLRFLMENENIFLTEPVSREIIDFYKALNSGHRKWKRSNRWRENYGIDERFWKKYKRSLHTLVDAIDSLDQNGKILKIRQSDYDSIFNLVSSARRYCHKDRKKGNCTDELLICYGYLGAFSHSRVVLLSDDLDIKTLLEHSFDDVVNKLANPNINLISKYLKRLVAKETIELN